MPHKNLHVFQDILSQLRVINAADEHHTLALDALLDRLNACLSPHLSAKEKEILHCINDLLSHLTVKYDEEYKQEKQKLETLKKFRKVHLAYS